MAVHKRVFLYPCNGDAFKRQLRTAVQANKIIKQNHFCQDCRSIGLLAIGNQAFVVTKNAKTRLPQELRHKKIQGFAYSRNCNKTGLVLLHAENEFCLFKYNIRNETFKLVFEGETMDWINTSTFLKGEKGFQFVLHMAHSSLLRLQYDDSNNVKFGHCNILELACCTDFSLLYHTSLHGDCFKNLLVLSGNGFGEILIWQPHVSVSSDTTDTCVKIYPLSMRLKAHNGVVFSIDFNQSARLLVTTSDDRSVKFWKLASMSSTDWSAVEVRPLLSCYGHTARVICVIIAEYDGQVFVISGGEDSFICVWNQFGDMLFKRRQQFGCPIWRLSFDQAEATLYSTGSTGNVLAYNLKGVLNAKHPRSTAMALLESQTETMKKIKYLSSSSIIALSNKNRLFVMKLSKSHKINPWELVSVFLEYKCTVLTVCNGLIATCGYKRVTLLRYDGKCFVQLYNGTKLEGLIHSFHFLSEDLYLISDEYGNCSMLKGYKMNLKGNIKLSNCRELRITAALFVAPNCLIIGCRNGTILLYTLEDSGQLKLKNSLSHLHGKMGSTFFRLLEADNKYAYILSGGHEPIVKHLRLCLTNYCLTVVQRTCVPLAWVEASALDILIGFNDNYLVAWSYENDVLMQLHCGGGHRCWDYQLNNEELQFIYVKQNFVFYHRTSLNKKLSGSILQASRISWHTRSCNIMQILEHRNIRQSYIVSAGDDNIIKISQLTNHSFNQCVELHTHISSVRHLVSFSMKSQSNEMFWLLFSVGGRAQLCINKLEPKGPVVNELCSHTVRSDFDETSALIDARLMSISIFQQNITKDFYLYVASAEGKIIMFRWQLQNPSQLHFIRFIDIQRCPLHITFLDNLNLLLITTTNGTLFGFDQSLSLKRLQIQLHSAGINAIKTVEDGSILHVLTGGDDEIIKHTTIRISDMTIKQSTKFSGLHTAQVNAIALHSYQTPEQSFELYAYTCSDDKQIFLVNLMTFQYFRIGYTCVSDIKGILLDRNNYLYIYGSGLQVLKTK